MTSTGKNDNNNEIIPDILQLKLWKAAAYGDTATVRLLALHGVDLDARNEKGETAFMLATGNQHVGTAKAILAAREFQYLQKLGTTLEHGGNFQTKSAWQHMPV